VIDREDRINKIEDRQVNEYTTCDKHVWLSVNALDYHGLE